MTSNLISRSASAWHPYWAVLWIVGLWGAGAPWSEAQGSPPPVRRVEVHDERVLMGDLMSGLRPEVAQMVMAPAPEPGSSRMFTGRDIVRRLKRAFVQTRGLDIPRRVRVERSSQRLTEGVLASRVKSAAERILPAGWHIGDADVRRGLLLPAGKIVVTVERPQYLRPGRRILQVRVQAGAARPVRLGVSVTLEAPAAGELEVERGDRIDVVVRFGGGVVRTTGVAQAAGRRGSTIAVLPRSARSLVHARVVGPGSVEVDL